jgi:YHS domain-containing protein
LKQKLFFLLFVHLAFFATAQTTTDALITKHYNLNKNIAIEGYDPVAYFIAQKPMKGNALNAVSHHGVVYHFSSKSNKELFLKSPDKFTPQYGGWCAYAMGAKGEKVEIDPETFKIVNGKLYLFYNAFFNNTLKDWNKDEANLKLKADNNWKSIFK